MIYVINLIFHGDFDAIVFISIWLHQDGLERREGHPGGVQQEKRMFLLWTCDTCYYPMFNGEYDGNIFILIWRHQDGLEHREGHPGEVQQGNLCFHYGRVIHVITQDVLLSVLGHPGEAKSR